MSQAFLEMVARTSASSISLTNRSWNSHIPKATIHCDLLRAIDVLRFVLIYSKVSTSLVIYVPDEASAGCLRPPTNIRHQVPRYVP